MQHSAATSCSSSSSSSRRSAPFHELDSVTASTATPSPAPSALLHADLHAFVPFAWEEKPGVPKSTQLQQQADQQLQLAVSFHIPATADFPLRIPPRLQHPRSHLSKTASFNVLPASSHHSSSSTLHAPKLLVRKQSFDSVVYAGGHGCRLKPLTRKHSHGSLTAPLQQQQQHTTPSRKLGTLIRKELDDPFMMAIQVCRKEPIRVFYHHDRACSTEEKNPARRSCDIHGGQQDFKHLTIRQLFTQQLHEDECLHKAQKQPLIVGKKHTKGPFTLFARCLGC